MQINQNKKKSEQKNGNDMQVFDNFKSQSIIEKENDETMVDDTSPEVGYYQQQYLAPIINSSHQVAMPTNYSLTYAGI